MVGGGGEMIVCVCVEVFGGEWGWGGLREAPGDHGRTHSPVHGHRFVPGIWNLVLQRHRQDPQSYIWEEINKI